MHRLFRKAFRALVQKGFSAKLAYCMQTHLEIGRHNFFFNFCAFDYFNFLSSITVDRILTVKSNMEKIVILDVKDEFSEGNDQDIQMKIKKLLLCFICRHIELLNLQN
jgi:hypothetical protein